MRCIDGDAHASRILTIGERFARPRRGARHFACGARRRDDRGRFGIHVGRRFDAPGIDIGGRHERLHSPSSTFHSNSLAGPCRFAHASAAFRIEAAKDARRFRSPAERKGKRVSTPPPCPSNILPFSVSHRAGGTIRIGDCSFAGGAMAILARRNETDGRRRGRIDLQALKRLAGGLTAAQGDADYERKSGVGAFRHDDLYLSVHLSQRRQAAERSVRRTAASDKIGSCVRTASAIRAIPASAASARLCASSARSVAAASFASFIASRS